LESDDNLHEYLEEGHSMLEILLIVVLSKGISRIVKSKGYKSGWFVVMFIVFWFAGEIGGAIIGMIIGIISTGGRATTTTGPGEPHMLIAYVCALIGAAAGAATAFLIVKLMPAQRSRLEEEELEEIDEFTPAPKRPASAKDEGQYYDPQARRIPRPPEDGPTS
jgi:hypothetical protein